MRNFVVALLIAMVPVSAGAQCTSNGIPCGQVQSVDVDTKVAAATATIMAQMPTPGTGVPNPDTTSGMAGSGLSYQPFNAVRPSRLRTGSCIPTSTGVCTGTWEGSSFPTQTTIGGVTNTTVVQPIGVEILNTAGGLPYECNFTSITLAGYAVICKQQQTLSLAAGILAAAVNFAPSTATPTSGLTVYVSAVSKIMQ